MKLPKKQLDRDRKTVTELMHDVGQKHGKAFRDAFKEYTGVSPVSYRQKFGHNAFALARNGS